jgi:hypothetical protein
LKRVQRASLSCSAGYSDPNATPEARAASMTAVWMALAATP